MVGAFMNTKKLALGPCIHKLKSSWRYQIVIDLIDSSSDVN